MLLRESGLIDESCMLQQKETACKSKPQIVRTSRFYDLVGGRIGAVRDADAVLS
jgi:hypothetical protein